MFIIIFNFKDHIMHDAILQYPPIIMVQNIYKNFIRRQLIIAQECIQKNVLQKNIKRDILKKKTM